MDYLFFIFLIPNPISLEVFEVTVTASETGNDLILYLYLAQVPVSDRAALCGGKCRFVPWGPSSRAPGFLNMTNIDETGIIRSLIFLYFLYLISKLIIELIIDLLTQRIYLFFALLSEIPTF